MHIAPPPPEPPAPELLPDELDDDGAEILAGVFLEEVAGALDGGVGLALAAGDEPAHLAVRAGGDRVAVAEGAQERALEAAEMTIRSLGTTDVRYTLVHAYFELGTMDPLLPSVTAEMHEAAVQGLADHLHRLKERRAPLDTDIRTSASFGPLASTVDREARELHADLVVMYTGDPSTRTVFGTNTARVIGEAHVPVLELPYEVRDLRIRRILLADEQDVVIMSSVQAWKYAVLDHADPSRRQALQASQRLLRGLEIDVDRHHGGAFLAKALRDGAAHALSCPGDHRHLA